MESHLTARHIQDMTLDSEMEPHWGYAERQMPCVNDPGSCEYLDVVYGSHDKGMIYVGIMWLTFVGILTFWGIGRLLWPKGDGKQGGLVRVGRSVSSSVRQHLLADFVQPIFGRTTRLQVLILAVLCGYLIIWSFVGIIYKIWITPVKDMPGVYNTRSSLGPWSDRVGVLAYALTPLSILLCQRESLLTVITGVPYQHFNFLHRWLGYVIVVQSILHTIGWSIIEIRLYQPQPMVAQMWITQLYMVWGVVAMGLLLILFVLSLPWVIRRTGYEFFRKAHYVLAMVYIGACIGHWKQLRCFLTPAIILWAMDHSIRFLRTYLLHRKSADSQGGLFNAAEAAVTLFSDSESGDVVRMDFEHPHKPWHIGQHFYLCFTAGSIWQSHPFTPLNAPEYQDGATRHSYIFRAKGGETKRIANLITEKQATSTGVILTGPYGEHVMQHLGSADNVLCVAGGTGITYVLPVILSLARDSVASSNRKVELVWFVRHRRDVEWIRPELDLIESLGVYLDLTVRVFTTRDDSPDGLNSSSASSSSSSNEKRPQVGADDRKLSSLHERKYISIRSSSSATTAAHSHHPDVAPIVEQFIESTVQGPTTVFASGPGMMMSELRAVIATCNDGKKVWCGEERWDVSLQCDDRLEY